MRFNRHFFKRYSTIANLIAMVAGAVITGVPTLGLSIHHVGAITITMNVVIIICQAFQQKADVNVIED